MDMQFNVAQLLKEGVGATRTIEFGTDYLPLGEVPGGEGGAIAAEDVHGRAKLTRLKGRLRANGEVEAQVELTCARCLDRYTTTVRAPIEEIYAQTVDVSTGAPVARDEYAPVEDDEQKIDKNHILDFSDTVRQTLLVNLPMQPLCREDCKGICPTCGANLNEAQCDCVVEDVDPRFAALATLLANEETVERMSKN